MPCVEGEIVIHRPAEVVFDFAADERNEPRYKPRRVSAETLSTGQIGVGTQFRAEMKTRRQTVPMIIECTEYQRPWRLASSTRLSSMTCADV